MTPPDIIAWFVWPGALTAVRRRPVGLAMAVNGIERRLSLLTWQLLAVVAMEAIIGVWLLLRPDAVGVVELPDMRTLTVSTIRTTSTTIEARNANLRRQYTDGGRSPTGRNMSRTP